MPGFSHVQIYLPADLVNTPTRSRAAPVRAASPPPPPQRMTLEEAQVIADLEGLSLDLPSLFGPPIHVLNQSSTGIDGDIDINSDDEDSDDDEDEAAYRAALTHVSTPISAPTSTTASTKTADEEANECPICQDTLITSTATTATAGNKPTITIPNHGTSPAEPDLEPSAIRLNTCGHAFHTACLAQWLCTANSCPYCRAPILSADVDAEIRGIWQSYEQDQAEAEDQAAAAEVPRALAVPRALPMPQGLQSDTAARRRERARVAYEEIFGRSRVGDNEAEPEPEAAGEDVEAGADDDGDSGVAFTEEPFHSRDDDYDDDEFDEDDGEDVDIRWYLTAEQQRMMARYGVAERELREREAARRTVPSGF